MNVQFIQTPSCGPPPLFEVHTGEFDNTLNQLDWNLINRTNVEYIKATSDSEALEQIIHSFVDSKFGAVERQFLPFPLSRKLYELLQLSVHYLLKKQTKIQQQMKQKDLEIEYLRHKIDKFYSAIPKMPSHDVSVVHSCPVCNKAYKSFYHLDKHMHKFHIDMLDAWNALRNKQPYGASLAIQELQFEINHLRECVTRQEFASKQEPPPPKDKFPIKPKTYKKEKTCGEGQIKESTCIQPGRYRSNILDFEID